MWECWQGISYMCVSSRDSWQSLGLHWQEHSQQMCWSGFSPLLCAHWSISRHGVQFHPSHPFVEYRKGSNSLGCIQCRPTAMAMAGAPSLWTMRDIEQEAEGPGIILLEKQWPWGWPISGPTEPTRRLPWTSSEVHGGRMRDKSCTSKEGNFWLDVRKLIFPKDSQGISRLPRDTTTSPSLEMFKIIWTKPWAIWGLLWAGVWARWAQKVFSYLKYSDILVL